MIYLNLFIVVASIFLAGIRIIRPGERGLIMMFGRYRYAVNPGFHWIIPFIERMYKVDITEQRMESEPFEIITYDKYFTRVKVHVSFRVKADEESFKGSEHNANNYKSQIADLARKTLRNIIGTLAFSSARSMRKHINYELYRELYNETQSWGIEIVKTELITPEPPKEMQENNVASTDSYEFALQ